MELADNERRAVTDAALIGEEAERLAGVKIRKISLGSLMQLQRIGNPYGRLGEVDFSPDENGEEPTLWAALGLTDRQEITRTVAEFVWLHAEKPKRVRSGLNLPPEERAVVVEEFMMRFTAAALPNLEEAIFTGVLEIQAGMVNPDAAGEDDGPLGRGRPGERP